MKIAIEAFETRAIAEAKGAYEAVVRMAANRRGIFGAQMSLSPDLTAFIVPDDPPLPTTQAPRAGTASGVDG